jgi:hypothetical protein
MRSSGRRGNSFSADHGVDEEEESMAARDDGAGLGAARVLDGDEVQGVLSGAFYQPGRDPRRDLHENAGEAGARAPDSERRVATGEKAAKPTHYKVICISMYTKDLGRLDELVEELKSRGITKANRSALIRVALEQLDLDKVPRGM